MLVAQYFPTNLAKFASGKREPVSNSSAFNSKATKLNDREIEEGKLIELLSHTEEKAEVKRSDKQFELIECTDLYVEGNLAKQGAVENIGKATEKVEEF